MNSFKTYYKEVICEATNEINLTNMGDFSKELKNNADFMSKYDFKNATIQYKPMELTFTFTDLIDNALTHKLLKTITYTGKINPIHKNFSKFDINPLLTDLAMFFKYTGKSIKPVKLDSSYFKTGTGHFTYEFQINPTNLKNSLGAMTMPPDEFIKINNKTIYFTKHQEEEDGKNMDYTHYNETIKALYEFYKFYMSKMSSVYKLEIHAPFENMWSTPELYKSWPFIFTVEFEIQGKEGQKEHTFEAVNLGTLLKRAFVDPFVKMNLTEGHYVFQVPFIPIAMGLAKESSGGWPTDKDKIEAIIIEYLKSEAGINNIGKGTVFTDAKLLYTYLKRIQGSKVQSQPETRLDIASKSPSPDHAKQAGSASTGGQGNYNAF